ncbi:uncharacterized protein N7515_004657 [Penicillium bovifimosum]|uniref:Uncharacterized protein n=1 Tax=Penicillium bovifimosum TaxID=126998 RepID=A0A9W9H0J7_9EURO|nr:uncharacterized protein N7515_004657 [Penicillium bovifimosum]KAJ5135379.1 hypothetical protein N7515_004657 [Penicillium bovifimosum]
MPGSAGSSYSYVTSKSNAHIPGDERLGLTVAPGRVRLQPSAGDGYAWSVSKSQEYLLKSNLSNGTVGLYQAILDALGHSIEAVSPPTLRESNAGSDKKMSDEPKEPSSSNPSKLPGTAFEGDSFTATIQRLEGAKQELTAELERAQLHSEKLFDEKEEWEAKYCRIHEELGKTKSLVKQLEEDLSRAHMGIAKAMEMLKGHRLPEKTQPCEAKDI